MMNNETNMTFQTAIFTLEKQYNAAYRGTKTVSEMCTDSITDAMAWDSADGDKVYHVFNCLLGCERVVSDEQLIALAECYA